MQKSLQGLDNVTAEGTEAIDNLTKMIETLVENGAEEGWGKTTEKFQYRRKYVNHTMFDVAR